MKAWIVHNPEEGYSTIVFAETRGKAKSIVLHSDNFEDMEFTELAPIRCPSADKCYKEGKVEMDWCDDEDRLFLVKELDWHCHPDCLEWEYCEECVAKEYCSYYQDMKTEER